MPRPNIVHVISGLETGGAEMMLLRLLGGTDRSRWRPSVISLRDRGTFGPRIESLGVPVRVVGMQGSVPTPQALWRLLREIRGLSPSLLQGWMYHGNLAAVIAKVLVARRVPTIWNIRYAPSDLALEKLSTAAAVRVGALLSSRVARIVYNSRAGAQRHAQLGYATTRAVVIPNGFDTDAFAPSPTARIAWRRRLGLSESTLLVGRIGRYHEMKDYPAFLEAAGLLARERPGVHFVLAGKGVDDRNADLTGAIARLGLHGTVHVLGEVIATNELTASLDIACSSSAFGEAFPNVLGEAMACGVPCVATDVGDSSWIIDETALVVPPRDPTALASAFRALIDAGPTERGRLGAKARARVIREFSLARALADYEALYRETIT